MADSTDRLSRSRLAEIRRLGEDESRTVLTMDNAVDDLLAEVDRLRELLVNTAQNAASFCRTAAEQTRGDQREIFQIAASGFDDYAAEQQAVAR